MEDYYQSETTVRKNGESEHKMQSSISASRSGEKECAKGGHSRAERVHAHSTLDTHSSQGKSMSSLYHLYGKSMLNLSSFCRGVLAAATLVVMVLASLVGKAQSLTVHDGTTTNGYVPVYGFYADAYLKSEFVYPAGELAAMNGATITGMTFYASQTSVSWGAANFQVFLREIGTTTISAFQGPGTVVYTGALSISGGTMTVNFATPYTYNGGNLLVGIYNTVEGDYVSSSWYGENVNGASVQGYSYSSLGEISPTQRNFIPKTTFTYHLPTPTITQTLNPLPGCGTDNATLTASLGGASMPTGYAYYWYSNAACTSEITSGVSGTNNNTLSYPASNGTQVWCRLEKRTVTITSTPSSTFDYNGGIQQYTVLPNTISLTLETWGAQGGSYNNTYVGGSGGYAKGILNSPAIGSTLYVVVGGQPNSVTSTTGGTNVPGGYNGGGNAVVHNYSSGYSVPQGGGGATHIATVSGLLSSLSAQQDNVLVVAGGGSGSVFYHKNSDGTDGGGTGYAGGGGTSSGYTGGSYTYTANQTTAGNGGSFGQGASYTGNTNYRYGPAGGGGGWYGGGNRQYAGDTYSAELVLGHGGGSGHVNSSLTGATMTTGGRTGHGMAKITASIGTTTVESVGDAGEISIQCAEVQCEGFEGGTMPTGWTSVSGIGTTSWSVGTGDYSTITGAHTGTYNAKIQSSTRSNETYLVSPSQDFSGASLVTLSFWYINREWASDIDELTVYYRTNTSDTWHQLFYTDEAHATWTQEQGINLPNLSSTYQIAFKWTSHYGYGVGIDDVCFVITPGDCTPPSISFGSISNTGTLGSAYSHPSLTCNSNGTRHWSSGNTNVATVDETSGVVTLKDCGQTTITLSVDATATYCSGTASYTLNVSGNTQSISNCPPGNLTSGSTWTPALNSGQSFTNWSSNNTSRATVNTSTGVVTLKQPGEVTISGTVPAYGSYCGGTVNCTFTVTCATNTSTFAFDPTNGSVAEDATLDISGNLTLPTGATVTSYTSDNPSVATVTNAGVVTGVSAGTAHITATVSQWTNDGVTYYCERTTTNSFTVMVTSDCDESFNMSDGLSRTIECGTTYCFYDDGGPGDSYTRHNNVWHTATFSSVGEISIVFSSFSGESQYDYMYVYDGAAGTNLILNTNTSTGTGAPSSDQTFTATSGTMTIQWITDNSVENAGWKAKITATSCCPKPTGVTVTNITDTSAQVGWTGDASASSYNVRYRKVVITEDFESGIPATWTTIDADGDGYNWNSHTDGTYYTHSGSGIAYSQSYDNYYGILYPDNWLITPQIELHGNISFWYRGQSDGSYFSEHFKVYVSTTGINVATDFTELTPTDLVATDSYQQYSTSLSSYAGQQGYIAIRHYNCEDQFYLNIDDFEMSEDWTYLTTGSTNINITGLNDLTEYEVQVQADCGGGNESVWVTETFTTLPPTPRITQDLDPWPQCGTEDATLTASLKDGVPFPTGYEYHWYSNSACTTEITSGVSGTNNNTLSYPASSSAQVWCRLEKRVTMLTYNYTGGVQSYTIPDGASAITMEVWGAQGGYRSNAAYGGKGGYSVGTLLSPTAGNTLYVVVGGSGNTGGTSGGYNGGGSRNTYNGGGGATHIATASGVLSSLSANQASVLIVAGGGGSDGGASDAGGAGGGLNGASASGGYNDGTRIGTGGTQSAGGAGDGSFGQGGSGVYQSSGYGGAGGGGWYGGGGTTPDGSVDDDSGGGGGSGYLKSTLTNASTTAGQREGNGQAKITAVVSSGGTLESASPAGTVTILCCGIDAEIQITNP